MYEQFWVIETPFCENADDWRARVYRLRGCKVLSDRGNKILVQVSDPEGLRLCVGDLCEIKPVN